MSEPATAAVDQEPCWADATLASLIQYIVARHHAYLREELPVLDGMITQFTASERGGRQSSVELLQKPFQQFRRELEGHLQKEEVILFPLIANIESETSQGRKPAKQPFGSIANPIGMMEQEHQAARRSLDRLRTAAHGYSSSPELAGAHNAICARLVAIESDLDTHSRLEDEILFPRATALESAGG